MNSISADQSDAVLRSTLELFGRDGLWPVVYALHAETYEQPHAQRIAREEHQGRKVGAMFLRISVRRSEQRSFSFCGLSDFETLFYLGLVSGCELPFRSVVGAWRCSTRTVVG